MPLKAVIPRRVRFEEVDPLGMERRRIGMKSVAVVATRAITPLGDLNATWTGLMQGRSALAEAGCEGILGRLPAGRIPGLGESLGTADRVETLIHLLFADMPFLPKDTALILATTKGAADELLAGPTGPWHGQPWDLASHISSKLGIKGPASTVSAACASGTLALIQGVFRVISGESDMVLVIGMDILSRFVLGGFSGLQALSPGPCRPFDRNREGLTLGEGIGLMLLTTVEEARRCKRPVLALLTGCGSACDAGHITAPSREASGLKSAIKQATDNGARRVGAINAHGTGTRYNDAMEIHAFTSLWKENCPPFHSVKGAIGHCLGAAGVIEAALAVESARTGLIPPTVGLIEPEPDVINVSGQQPLALSHPSILSCNSGFGGINAAVLIEGSGLSNTC